MSPSFFAHRVDRVAARAGRRARRPTPCAGVLGDREHAHAARERCVDDVPSGERPSPDTEVWREVADHVAERCRQQAFLGGLDLALVLAQHWRDPRQPESAS